MADDIIKNGYIFSERVKVFPCAFRGDYVDENGNLQKADPEARVNTENNFRKLKNVIGNSMDSYIIDIDTTNNLIKCVLGNYYFEIDITGVDQTKIYETKEYKYLNIKIAAFSQADSVLDNSPVLVDFETATPGTVLDSPIEGSTKHYFLGLKFSDTKSGNYSIDLTDDSYKFPIKYVDVESALSGTCITGNLLNGKNSSNNDNQAVVQLYKSGTKIYKNEASGASASAFGINTLASGKGAFAEGYDETILVDREDTTIPTGTTVPAGTTSFSPTLTDTQRAMLDENPIDTKYYMGETATDPWQYVKLGDTGRMFLTTVSDHAQVTPDMHIYKKLEPAQQKHKGGATGNYSHAEGYCTLASGLYSHAEGEATTASGPRALAIGHNTVASGANSYAGGNLTKATAENTFAFGVGTTADQINMTALGIKNAPTKDGDLLVVGNARTIDENASTILEVNREHVNIFDYPLNIKRADPAADPYLQTELRYDGIKANKGEFIGLGAGVYINANTDPNKIELSGLDGNTNTKTLTVRDYANVAGQLTAGSVNTAGQLSASSVKVSSGNISTKTLNVNDSAIIPELYAKNIYAEDRTTGKISVSGLLESNLRLSAPEVNATAFITIGANNSVQILPHSGTYKVTRYFKTEMTKNGTSDGIWGFTTKSYSNSERTVEATVPAIGQGATSLNCTIEIRHTSGISHYQTLNLYISEGASSSSETRISLSSGTYISDGAWATIPGDKTYYSPTGGLQGVTVTADILPYNNDSFNLGAAAYKWSDIYATNGTIQTSDREQKTDITEIDSKYSDLFDSLKPVQYKFKDGHRTHLGFIAQDVEEALNDNNIDTEDFAGFIKQENDEETKYGLRYTELIGLLVKEVQDLKAEIKQLKEKK